MEGPVAPSSSGWNVNWETLDEWVRAGAAEMAGGQAICRRSHLLFKK